MTRQANAQRGEASFAVDGEILLIRPTFSALVAAEEEVGSLFELVDRAAAGAITLSEVTALLWHCLPLETRPERARVEEAVMSMGLLEATKPIRVILAQVLKGTM